MRSSASFLAAPVLVFFAVACGGSGGEGSSHTASGPGSGGGTSGTGGGATTTGTAGGGTGGAAGAGGTSGAGGMDAGQEAGTDCSVDGNPGMCMEVSSCTALPGHSSTPGYCPGPADIECCTETPNVANNPPVPAGWMLMQQADVTPAMTAWAVAILNDPTGYPMFSTAMMTFGTLMVLARVEWHPPDFQNNTVHRGVTLYEPV